MRTVRFGTTLFGRFGHMVIAVVGLILGAFGIFPLYKGAPVVDVLVALPMAILGLWLTVYSASYALEYRPRIACSRAALTYRGIWHQRVFPWDDLERVYLDYRGGPTVFLKVVRNGGKLVRPALNVSGLSPTHDVLLALVQRLAPRVKTGALTGAGADSAAVIAAELLNGL